jgi:hypothetical protein
VLLGSRSGEFDHLLGVAFVLVEEDERERLGGKVATADEPFVSLKSAWMSTRDPLLGQPPFVCCGSCC